MMKALIQLANSCLPEDAIRSQFEFAQDCAKVYGIASGKGVWYTIEESNLYIDKQLFPVPKGEVEDTNGIIYQEVESYYPYDEFKCSKVTTDRIADWVGLYEHRKFVKVDKLPTHLLVLDNKCYTLEETIEPSDIPLWNNALPPVTECSGVIDMGKTLEKLLGQLNKKSIKGYGIHIQKNKTPIVHVSFTKGYAAIPAAMLPTCKNNGYEIISDENGILTEKGKQIMMEKLSGLKIFGQDEPTADDVLKDIEKAAELNSKPVSIVDTVAQTVKTAVDIVAKPVEAVVESVEPVVPTAVKETAGKVVDVIATGVKEVANVLADTVTAEDYMKQAEVTYTPEETTTESPKEEAEPMSIDVLKYKFAELKTMVSAFDKYLREYSKVGACNKKIQTELDKLRNENIKLRDEIKARIKDSEQLEKIKKYLATMAE